MDGLSPWSLILVLGMAPWLPLEVELALKKNSGVRRGDWLHEGTFGATENVS